ncbi:putative protein [Arabidopsis thaliana]|jgi:hypothetical protein|uniref:AT5g11760/T22P22_150 n=2 Tax=Arabidopsis thaliana TaxID=3702 RepID=Q9LYF4_ARATH|nr:stress response protein [Arabidopsis thaliana]AAL06996.1 AT5g11760/T22P22_150 [Arabidopsis thaliana]AAL31120.1 AT5g11760/T22P22_150 [Arabidopsis thaliana]AED91718.1 stress response protein [Arabidopsis thaliana]CAA0402073.1 unnamed protein product [Arabidopsis thaliana]CAB87694.1 putative protein [Arabidopsis thaliana]|eukprot:NP_196737.1 stress response protein [Arabidopsis thaliana]
MSKKRKARSGYLKKSSQGGDEAVVQRRKLVPKPGKIGKEIDDIFAGRSQRTPEVQNPESRDTPEAQVSESRDTRAEMNELNVGVNNNTESRPRTRILSNDTGPRSRTRRLLRTRRPLRTRTLRNNRESRPSSSIFNNDTEDSRPRKTTEDGLRVFTENEIGFNRKDAGGTRFCPFDCYCCF